MKNVQTQLAKSVSLSLELIAEASASGSSINITSLDSRTTVIISNEEMKDIMKIFKSLE